MLQRLLSSDALVRIEGQHPLEQIDRKRVDAREERSEVLRWLELQALEVVAGFVRAHFVDLFARRLAEEVGDQIKLMVHIVAGEQGLAPHQLREDAADRPDVDRGGVLGVVRADELRRAVPAGGHVVGPEDGVLLVWEVAAREPEVAYLEVAVRIEQHVARLEVAVENVRAVYVLQSRQELVDQPLPVGLVVLGFGADHVRQVGVKQLENDIDVIEGGALLWE